ncbi:TlpA family protein disulfide reductase [Thiothrix eikelboomii]|nr:TlpA disulfide reductase family protein [Thiothrix eikelboomii]
MIRTKYWLALAVLVISSLMNPCLSAEEPDETVTVPLSGQLETSIHRFGQASQRILWFSTPATQAADFNLAKQLAAYDLEIWLTSLEAIPKKPATHQTPQRLSPTALAELIQASLPSQAKHPLFIFSIGDSAKATLEGLNTWQETHGHAPALTGQLTGLVLAYPHLQLNPSKPKSTKRIEATYPFKLPIYVFQTTEKSKLKGMEALVTALEQGGNTVYSELLNDTTEGFLQGQAHSEEELLQLSVFPAQLAQAVATLAKPSLKPQPQITNGNESPLQAHPTQSLAPELRLPDLAGKIQDLKDYRGKVVLLNFWATWCPPCIKEIPSLNNLQSQFSKDEFVVLSVDVGEELKEIKTFLEHVPADYPVLVDTTSSLIEPWQLQAFPSTYLLDRQGRLRYQYFGGLEWDEPQLIKFIEQNLGIMAK